MFYTHRLINYETMWLFCWQNICCRCSFSESLKCCVKVPVYRFLLSTSLFPRARNSSVPRSFKIISLTMSLHSVHSTASWSSNITYYIIIDCVNYTNFKLGYRRGELSQPSIQKTVALFLDVVEILYRHTSFYCV